MFFYFDCFSKSLFLTQFSTTQPTIYQRFQASDTIPGVVKSETASFRCHVTKRSQNPIPLKFFIFLFLGYQNETTSRNRQGAIQGCWDVFSDSHCTKLFAVLPRIGSRDHKESRQQELPKRETLPASATAMLDYPLVAPLIALRHFPESVWSCARSCARYLPFEGIVSGDFLSRSHSG